MYSVFEAGADAKRERKRNQWINDGCGIDAKAEFFDIQGSFILFGSCTHAAFSWKVSLDTREGYLSKVFLILLAAAFLALLKKRKTTREPSQTQLKSYK